MGQTIDYFFAPQSPWTYLGHERFGRIAAAAGATIHVRPVDLGRVFAVSGGLPLAKRPAQRQAYRLVELKRYSRPPRHPAEPAPRALSGGRRRRPRDSSSRSSAHDGTAAAMNAAGSRCCAGVWVEERDIADPQTLAALLGESGLPARRLDDAQAAEVQRALRPEHAGRDRPGRLRRADLRDRRRAVLGPGPARLRRAPAGARQKLRTQKSRCNRTGFFRDPEPAQLRWLLISLVISNIETWAFLKISFSLASALIIVRLAESWRLVLLDVVPHLLRDLGARHRLVADDGGQRGARGHRLHEGGVRSALLGRAPSSPPPSWPERPSSLAAFFAGAAFFARAFLAGAAFFAGRFLRSCHVDSLHQVSC